MIDRGSIVLFCFVLFVCFFFFWVGGGGGGRSNFLSFYNSIKYNLRNLRTDFLGKSLITVE